VVVQDQAVLQVLQELQELLEEQDIISQLQQQMLTQEMV
jgi:hypothetical protein